MDNAVQQMKRCAQDAEHCALMADHHLGYSVPIGGVMAYQDRVSPSGVGFDIGCGNKAVLLDCAYEDIKTEIPTIMDDIWQSISFGVGRVNKEKCHHPLFDDDPAWYVPEAARLRQLARNQLGTIGSGNHYVDLLVDEKSRVWVGVHFGSRGLGYKLANHFIKVGGGQTGMHADPVLLEVHTSLGAEYVTCMRLAGRYAYAGRDWVCERVAALMGAAVLEEVHNHHNFAWEEEHGGQELWVVRKGATPAFPGQRGFVGGSMGDCSVILEGIDSAESEKTLYSTVHGAGRVMSRRRAAGKVKYKKGRPVQMTPGEISREMMLAWITDMGVELRGAGTDESPHCYKRLPDVLKAHQNTIKVVHVLRPIGVAMAGADKFNPFKD